MSNKRILNITSKKKQDNMAVLTNTSPATPVGSTTYTQSAPLLNGVDFYFFPWCATARPATTSSGADGNPIDNAIRTASTCFMRGLKENVEIATNNGRAWQWRRVCFTMKGDDFTLIAKAGYRLDVLSSSGNQRVVNSHGRTLTAPEMIPYVDKMFKGTVGLDWTDPFTAKLDTTRISVKYDRTRILQSGNEQGILRKVKMWHPMNKNLVYDDDESGDQEITNKYSVDSKVGMGDYYVVDMIKAGTGGTSDDRMAFVPQATLYWHEK